MATEHRNATPPSDLYQLLRTQVSRCPDKLACAYLSDDGEIQSRLDFASLDLNARSLAARLQALDADGEAAILLYPPGLDFIVAFFACVYAGVLAIPLPMPRGAASLAQTKGIVADTEARLVLSTKTFISKLHRQDEAYFQDLICLDTQTIDTQLADAWHVPTQIEPADIAYLQYTSGSTSERKGVMISHANVIENILGIDRGFQHDSDSVAVNWLPHFHDLGLVSGILQPLYHGVSNYLMAPTSLVQKPLRWLQAISDFGGTHTNSPNYAYDLCIKKIAANELDNLDLSSWRVALNGAEPVRAETVRQFYEKFRRAGLAKTTMYPAYGLAEATLVVTAPLPDREPQTLTVESAALEHGIINQTTAGSVRELVACGEALPNTTVAIVDPDSYSQLGDGQVGEIWVSGPGVAVGYWRNEIATEETFCATLPAYPEAKFLRTGDLGFLRDRQLYITGRAKDLIIIRGANHYPQDIEWTVENIHPAFKAGCGAAFSIPTDGEEKLIVVYELEREYLKSYDIDELAKLARQAVAVEHEVQLYGLVLLKTATVPRTSSGKIQRRQCRHDYLNGALVEIASWQSDALEQSIDPPSLSSGQLSEHQLESAAAINADDLIDWLRNYAETRLNSRSYDERRLIPPHVFLDFGNHGILGLQTPIDYGGIGLSSRDALRVIEQIAAIDLTLAMMTIVHNTLGIAPILQAAKLPLKKTLLPRLATGRELVAFAITETGAGSNPRAITTSAVQIANNQWRISGEKIWSGSAGWASVINVFAQHIDLDGNPRGMIGFVIPTSHAGVRIGPEAKTFGMRGMVQNKIHFDNVLIDDSYLLGEPGHGMAVAQGVMQRGRLMIAGACIGGMKRCVQLMTAYANRRKISTGVLLNNDLWMHRITQVSYQIHALESCVETVAAMEDSGELISADIFAALKITAPEYLWYAADMLMQLLGGRGYMEQNIAPQLLRDARVARILEGPTEALQMYLGARVCRDAAAFYDFVERIAKDESTAKQTRECVDELVERYGQEHVFLCAVGELAAHAILLACLRAPETGANDGQDLHHKTLAWAEQRLSQLITQLNAYESSITSIDLMTLAGGYQHSIGDVTQSLPGFDEELDPLLQRQAMPVPDGENNELAHPRPTTRQIDVAPDEPPQRISPREPEQNELDLGEFIVEWLNRELKLPNGRVKLEDTFFEHGVDSVTSVMLTVAIEEQYDFLPEPEVVYDYPRIADCAAEIARQIGTAEATKPKAS